MTNHALHFFFLIILVPMGRIVPMFTNFDVEYVNKSNAPLKLQKLHS
jgi:hypothetical protein